MRQFLGDSKCEGQELDGALVDVETLMTQHANVSVVAGGRCVEDGDEDEDEDEDGGRRSRPGQKVGTGKGRPGRANR